MSVALGFGTLPTDVAKGAPATATLTIVDAEGAVVRARFGRLNDEILSKHALTLADAANRAIGARMDDPCGKQAAAYRLAGGSTIAGALRSNAQAIEDGTLTLEDVLAGASFVLPLSAANDDKTDGSGGPVLWGRGERQALESTNSALAWDGTVRTGQLGIDTCLRKNLVTGLILSHSAGDFDYSADAGTGPVRGRYGSRMTGVHPYLGWTSPQGLTLWATAGYGRGDIEIEDEEVGRQVSDTALKTAAAGARGPLITGDSPIAGSTMALGLRSEASWAQVGVGGDGDLIEKQTVNAWRLRLALEGSHTQALAAGGSLTASVELGLRHDGGDGITGSGLELGAGLSYRHPVTGVTVAGDGRILIGQDGYREWGLGGSVRFGPGARGRGLSFSLTPAWGDTASGLDRLWERDAAALTAHDGAANGGAANDNAPPMRLEAELGYGFGAYRRARAADALWRLLAGRRRGAALPDRRPFRDRIVARPQPRGRALRTGQRRRPGAQHHAQRAGAVLEAVSGTAAWAPRFAAAYRWIPVGFAPESPPAKRTAPPCRALRQSCFGFHTPRTQAERN